MADGSEQKSLPIYTVDAFASAPFTGNSAAVCPISSAEEDIPDDLKCRIAMEMNISETAFVHPAKSGETFQNASEFNLRWFTPINEVKLCGHATMATATTIFRALGNEGSELRFNTLSGQLVAKRDGQLITLNLPVNPCSPKVPENLDGLIQEVISDLPVQEIKYSPGTKKLLLRLKDDIRRASLEGLTPNISKFMSHHNTGEVKGVIVTVKASGEVNEDGTPYDFFSRYFAPWNGILEDPVTGAAHTVLSDYWSGVLGKQELFARQCSKRGGDVRIRLLGDNRVELAGKAALVIQGKINI
ncbi:phenazine biosynthesis-like domain-containing protein isoform X3 [Lytechinus variegatus]|uniref:phenazine biosynthesis-like domain-containing protein isoform X3 n=1 Tax=Lytechinus variegatus TaxID=7654 RepID=UPI001BB179BE|nr:phenazine biosynthesis-like domain-containing protein isoform X3 [Lytechinus variegatus]